MLYNNLSFSQVLLLCFFFKNMPLTVCVKFFLSVCYFVVSIRVEALAAGAVTDISVDMVSPSNPGIYQSKWRMLTPTGSYFGDTIWVILTVAEGGTLALTQQLSHLHELGSSPRSNNLLNPFHPTNQGTIVPHIHAIFQVSSPNSLTELPGYQE